MPQSNGNTSAEFLRKKARKARRKQHKVFVEFLGAYLPRFCEKNAARGAMTVKGQVRFYENLKEIFEENDLLPDGVDFDIVKAALLEVLETKMPGVRLVGNKVEKEDLRHGHFFYPRGFGNYDGFKFVLTWEKEDSKESKEDSKEDDSNSE
jgi:hypothetical protein